MKNLKWCLWTLFALGLLAGAARIHFDVEVLNLLPDQLPVVRGLKEYQQYFSNSRELILTLESPNPEETESAARALAAAFQARSDLVKSVSWQPFWMQAPGEAGELMAYLWLNQIPEEVSHMADRLSRANLSNTLAATRERLTTSLSPRDMAIGGYDPFGLLEIPSLTQQSIPFATKGDDMFASETGTFRVMFVEASAPLTSYRDCRAWLQKMRAIASQTRVSAQIPDSLAIHYTGRPAFVTEIAGGMENDMGGSSTGTLAVIGLLFYLTHRRLRPLFWLLGWLLFLLAATVAIGGLLFGTVNVVSLGFAAILTGLAEDFGIVLFEETQSHPELNAKEIRKEAAPGILWSAVTTAGGFLALNLSGLPGLGQLGSFVAIGIVLAAGLMLYGFVPPLLRWRRPDRGQPSFLLFAPVRLLPAPTVWTISVLLILASAAVLFLKPPSLDRSSDPLRPKKSEAYETLGELRKQLGQREEPLWILIPGKSEAEVLGLMERANTWLATCTNQHLISGYTLPLGVWPHPDFQASNRTAITKMVADQEAIEGAALGQGFTTNALALTRNIFASWRGALATPGVFWPTTQSSTWLLDKFSARTKAHFIAAGFIRPEGPPENMETFAKSLPKDLQQAGVLVSGWQLLGRTVFSMVMQELPKLMTAICGLVLLSLWLAFRSVKQVLLSVATLLFSAVCLWAAMDILEWRWNLLSLMALPLFIGVGVDFSIHMQLALKRYHGDRAQVRKSVGRALLLAGSTTLAGFGSLAFSSNFGMASLGKVCALGLMITMLTAIYLLPVWWTLAVAETDPGKVSGHS